MKLSNEIKARLRTPVLAARRVRRERVKLVELAYAQPRSFSQFGEDRWLARYFQDQPVGFYVDVGAFHPFLASNTYALYRRGWRGINLEPAPDGLAMLRKHRPRDLNLPFAVSQEGGEVQFTLTGSFAGIDDEQHLWQGMPGPRITVRAQPLTDILDEYLPVGTGIDLLDVDCEGHDVDVLRSNDWERYRPRIVLCEHHAGDEKSPDPGPFLEEKGYVLHTRLDLTCVYVRS